MASFAASDLLNNVEICLKTFVEETSKLSPSIFFVLLYWPVYGILIPSGTLRVKKKKKKKKKKPSFNFQNVELCIIDYGSHL